jgi:hypothetical protein
LVALFDTVLNNVVVITFFTQRGCNYYFTQRGCCN